MIANAMRRSWLRIVKLKREGALRAGKRAFFFEVKKKSPYKIPNDEPTRMESIIG